MKRKIKRTLVADFMSGELSGAIILLASIMFGFIFACYVWGNDSSYLNNITPFFRTNSFDTVSFYELLSKNLLLNAGYFILFIILSGFTYGYIVIPLVLAFKTMRIGFAVCSVIKCAMDLDCYRLFQMVTADFVIISALFFEALISFSFSKQLLNKETVCRKASPLFLRFVCLLVLLVCIGVKTAVVLL